MKTRIVAVLGVLAVAWAGLIATTPAQAAPVRGQDTGLYFPLTPVRAWDSRVDGSKVPLPEKQSLRVQILGRLGVPASGVSAVTMNLTVVSPTRNSYITVHPSGTSRPGASSINFRAGDTRANTITMPVDTDGGVRLWNYLGTAHVIIDVTGFYAKDNTIASNYGTGAGMLPVSARLVDSRTSGTPIPAGQTRKITYRAASSTRPTERGLYLNVTVPSPRAAGYLRVWNGVGNPSISTLNWKGGEGAVANTTAIGTYNPADNSVSFSITNRSPSAIHYIVDVLGAYDMEIWDTKYVKVNPRRVLDTRTGVGLPRGKLGAGQTKTVTLPSGFGGANVYGIVGNAVILNISTNGSFIRIWDNDPPPPTISTVNGDRGDVVANGVVTMTHYSNKTLAVSNYRGTVDAILDVTGYFAFETATTSAAELERKSAEARAGVMAVAAAAQAP